MKLTHDQSQLDLVELLENYSTVISLSKQDSIFSKIKGFFKPVKMCTINKVGAYIWGDVGRGKSTIMDLFFGQLQQIPKKRIHFHQFMSDFHKSLVKWHSKGSTSQNSAILQVVNELARNVKVICLDELQVNNVADAMVLQKLFDSLFKKGMFIFITSNFKPEDLFKDGLQREKFLPCIQLINDRLDVFNLNNYIDYRLEKIANIEKLYYWPLNEESQYYIQLVLSNLLGEHDFVSKVIKVDDNKYLNVLRCYGKIAIFSFVELCKIPLGILDYLAICNNFNTIIITEILQMKTEDHNEVLRFITLIDCMYENKNKLICTAEVAIDNLYIGQKHNTEFKRTISRLYEMQSTSYLKQMSTMF